ncbi:MAG: tetratricopeptide repeat protein [Planctomycetota bacterium]|jgi:tetratricopeptide (TPR) repeat protein|nr:tetratricopeptide repeat protein [Planctomycetota bacterium]MDP6941259.1 tetratricopeptide repeat protein [Planctomycetota bacterium]
MNKDNIDPSSRSARDAFLLIFLCFLAFSSTLSNEWIWDDDDYVVENPVLTQEGGLERIWTERRSIPQWYPLVHTTFWVERRVWGDAPGGGPNPFGYHLDNLLLHALTGVVLWRLLRRLRVAGAWFIAALFILHPVTVESVAWVTERKNVLSLLLALSSIHSYLGWAEYRKTKSLVFSTILFIAALFSKTVVASAPAVIVLLLWWRKRPFSVRVWSPLVAMLALGGWMGWQTAVDEMQHVGAQGTAWEYGFIERTLIAGRILWSYAATLCAPFKLIFIYPRWEINPAVWWQYLWPAGAMGAIIFAFKAIPKYGRGPLVGLLIFGGVLFPALGYLNVYPHQYSFVADHFQHHAAPALIVLIGSFLATKKYFLPNPKTPFEGPVAGKHSAMTMGSWSALLLVLAILSFNQGKVYENEKVLWLDVVEKNPAASIAYNNLGLIAHKEGKTQEAIMRFRQAIETKGENSQALNNLGQLLLQGLATIQNPSRRETQMEEARAFLEEAIRVSPIYVKPHVNLGDYWRIRGEIEKSGLHAQKAVEYYQKANKLNESGPIPFVSLTIGRLLAGINRAPEAVQEFERALNSNSSRISATLALVWLHATHKDRAVHKPARAVQLAEQLISEGGGNSWKVLDAAAAAYAAKGEKAKAQELAKRAIFIAMEQKEDQASGQIRKRLDTYR